MKVKVLARTGWGKNCPYPVVKEIEINDKCPTCGEPRGEPQDKCHFENDETHVISVWHNPCGHVDKYADCLAEYINWLDKSINKINEEMEMILKENQNEIPNR